jgi:hypothetical protein
MAVPATVPVGLTDEFARASRRALWQAFIKKNGLPPNPWPPSWIGCVQLGITLNRAVR